MIKKKIGILSLFVAFALCMAALCVSFDLRARAESNISSTGIFTTLGGAAASNEEYSDGVTRYLTYTTGDQDGGDSVVLRKNVALKWYTFADAENPTVTDAGTEEYFSLEIGFKDTNFTDFTVALETTQMSMSKAGKTVNEIVFTPAEGGISVAVNGVEWKHDVIAEADMGNIRIELSEAEDAVGYGDFIVSVGTSEEDMVQAGTFKNIGRYYAQYASSSADTPITPLTFKANTEEANTVFEIRSLNGQSFELVDENNNVRDNVAPALVIDSEIRQLFLGEQVSIEYTAIDVCSSSVTTNRYYLVDGMPVKETGDDGTETEVTPAFDEDGELAGYNDLASDKRFFETDFPENAAGGTLSIAFELTDGNANDAYYFIEWYADDAVLSEGHLRMVLAETVDARPLSGFYTVNEDSSGTVTSVDETEFGDRIEAYQTAVNDAAVTEDEDGNTVSIQVGSGAYFYVPSLKPYFTDATCGYTDMEFTVYYRKAGTDTQTVSGDYDELRIPVETEGYYEFCVVPTNSAGNAMAGVFERGGSYYYGDIETSNVWDAENVAVFGFTVKYNGAVIEEPEEEEVGYVDVTYTVGDFEIVALSGYETQYSLYYFVPNDGVTVSSIDEIKAAEQADGTNTLGTWRKINEYDADLEDGAEGNDNDYSWSPDSSLSFIPQETGFYKVEIEVDDKYADTVSAYKIINVTSQADIIPGTSDWLRENVLSVVFLCVGALCLVAIVVLLLVKPKDKATVEAERARKAELKAKRENRK